MFGCGGSKDTGPSAATTSAATTTAATTTVPALTINDVAVSLSDEINVSFIAAMREGTSDLTARGPVVSGLMAALRFLLPETLYAQSARAFAAPCRRGGTTTVRYGGARSRDINLQGVQVVHANCGGTAGSRPFTFNGTMTANGRWRADNPQDPVKITGSVNVNEITAPVTVDCTTGPAICVGQAGGITIGAGDRPPPPNPTSTTTSTIRPGTTTTVPGTTTSVAATTSVPGGSGSVNVTGVWRSQGMVAMTLSQTGSSISGTAAVPPLPAGAALTANSISGSISGSTVTLVVRLVITVAAEGATIVSTSTSNMTLQATNTTMVGTSQTTSTAVCSGSQFCPGPVTTGSNDAISVTK